MKISIVMPVYNSCKYLAETLDSIINQSYLDIELICVDDGSTDNSLDILRAYERADNRIKIIENKVESKGAALARNIGLEHAAGEYVIFLDSDDLFESNMIELLANKIEVTGTEVIIFDAICFEADDATKCRKYYSIDLTKAPEKAVFNYKDCPETIFQIGDIAAWNKIYKRQFLLDYELKFESIYISDDQYVPILALVFADKISIVDEVLLKYRVNTGVSQNDGLCRHPEAGYEAMFSVAERMREAGIFDTVKRSYVNRMIKFMRDCFDRMNTYELTNHLYDIYNQKMIPFLGAEHLSKEYFYDYRIASWYEMITTTKLNDIIFHSARGYGASLTTGILRFQIPYDEIKRNSRIVLVGKGIAGRYWYAQLLLSEYAEVVAWVASDSEISKDIVYDEIVYAK